jgi:hypothetical protein
MPLLSFVTATNHYRKEAAMANPLSISSKKISFSDRDITLWETMRNAQSFPVSFSEIEFTQASAAVAWCHPDYCALDIECEAAATSRRLDMQRVSDSLIASTVAIAESIEDEALDPETERPTLYLDRDTLVSIILEAA